MLYVSERPQPLIICTVKIDSNKEEIHHTIFQQTTSKARGIGFRTQLTPTRCTRAMPYFDESPQHLNAPRGTQKHNYYAALYCTIAAYTLRRSRQVLQTAMKCEHYTLICSRQAPHNRECQLKTCLGLPLRRIHGQGRVVCQGLEDRHDEVFPLRLFPR